MRLRTRTADLLAGCTLLLAACGTSPDPEPELYRVDDTPAPHVDPADPFRSPAPPAPADDIPESERIEFHERQSLAPLVPPGDRGPHLGYQRPEPRPNTRPRWWPPITSSRAYSSQDAMGPWDTLRLSRQEQFGPHWNRFGWYDW